MDDLSIIIAMITSITVIIISFYLNLSKKINFSKKICVITGGSSGLGKALAAQLLLKGANVIIIARNNVQLEITLKTLKEYKIFPEQKLWAISADVTDFSNIDTKIKSIETNFGRIDVVFTCAGSSKPGFFVDQDIEDYKSGMDLNYFGTLNTIKAVVDSMIRTNVNNGRIVMVSSTLGLMGMIGYSQYSPTKFALRGLAECLRQELIPYGIKISIYFVSTIRSPGYDKENLTKPKITKLIEDGDTSDPSPEARAKTLLKGIERGEFFITSDMITDLFRVMGSGISPWNNLIDFVYILIGLMFIPLWRYYSDYLVMKEYKKHK